MTWVTRVCEPGQAFPGREDEVVAGPKAAVAAPIDAAGPGRAGRRWVWLAAVAAFFLMGAGWAIGLPANGTYDESQHIVRAYGAASGHLYAAPAAAVRGGGAWVDVPRSLLPGNLDCTYQTRAAASCQTAAPDDHTKVRVGTAAGRYNPVYYAIVGLPMVASPNFAGIVGGRLVSALGSAVLLGFAALIAIRRRRPLLLAGLVVVVTPMVMNLSGAINPNGWEIAAGALLWTALLTLLRARPGELDERFTRLLVVLSGVSGALLLVLRALGPGFLAMILVACILLGRRAALFALLRRRDARWTLAACALVAAYALVWMAISSVANSDGAVSAGSASSAGFGDATRYIVFTRLTFWVDQIIGQFSYGETTLPNWSILAWYLMVGALLIPALAVVRRLQALVLVGILVASLGALYVLELLYLHTIGWSQHGRYVMPFGVGLVLAACILPRFERLMAPAARRLVPGLAVVAGALQLWALLVVQTRFQFGQGHGINPLHGSWKPPLGGLMPLAVEFVGVAFLAGLAYWAARASGTGSTPGIAPEAPLTSGRAAQAQVPAPQAADGQEKMGSAEESPANGATTVADRAVSR
jgi:hypothetical protein